MKNLDLSPNKIEGFADLFDFVCGDLGPEHMAPISDIKSMQDKINHIIGKFEGQIELALKPGVFGGNFVETAEVIRFFISLRKILGGND